MDACAKSFLALTVALALPALAATAASAQDADLTPVPGGVGSEEEQLEQMAPVFDARLASSIVTMDVSGDSISKAFNGRGSWPCANADQESYNWATSDTHGASLCSAGSEAVYSQKERIECVRGAHITAASPNHAKSGAQMLKDFVNQANAIKAWLQVRPGPRYAPVLLGHNDVCAGNVDNFPSTCGTWSGSQDRTNYCRTTPAAYERELRRGLDILITVPDTHVGMAPMVRVSQLCNHGWKLNCQSFTPCQSVWTAVAYLGWIFGQNNGICGSLTVSCSASRIASAYRTAKRYRDITASVAAQYSLIPVGGTSPVVTVGGATVGGATKAVGVTVVYSDAPWRYRFSASQLNCCDCFHPSPSGQSAAARVMMNGYFCTPSEPCCLDTTDHTGSGRCQYVLTDGTYIPGLFN